MRDKPRVRIRRHRVSTWKCPMASTTPKLVVTDEILDEMASTTPKLVVTDEILDEKELAQLSNQGKDGGNDATD